MPAPAARAVRLVDVAREAGVSVAAVSLALSETQDGRDLSPGTVERIRVIAARLGYRRNWVARAMQAQRTGLIGLLFQHGEGGLNPFQASTVSALSLCLAERGLDLALVPSLAGPAAHARLHEGRFDGIVAFGRLRPEAERALAASGLRSVRFNAPGPDGSFAPDCRHVGFDDARAVRDVMAHLAGLGHRRIAYLRRPDIGAGHGSERLREAAYAATAPDAAVHARPEAVLASLRAAAPPTAVLCYNDDVAIRLHGLLLRDGRRIPDDIAIAGIDDQRAAVLVTPSLTSLRLPLAAAMRRCVELIVGPAPAPGVELLRGELIPRASTTGEAGSRPRA